MWGGSVIWGHWWRLCLPVPSHLPVYADMEVFGRRLSLPSQFSETERLGGEKNAVFFFFNVDFFKSLLYLLQYCFTIRILFYVLFFFFGNVAYGILAPWPGIELTPPGIGMQWLNHWTTRDIPRGLSDSHPFMPQQLPFLGQNRLKTEW